MVAALLLAAALACSAAAAPIAMSRRMLQAPSLPGGPRTLTVINRCSQELKVAIAYPFDHSDPTQGGWCTNPDAWQTGWCYERGRPLAPGATLTSMETTQPLPPAPTAFVTAYRHDHLDVYVPGYSNEDACLGANSEVFCACSFSNCFAWFRVETSSTVELKCAVFSTAAFDVPATTTAPTVVQPGAAANGHWVGPQLPSG